MTQNTEKLLMCLAELNCKIEKTEEGAILITPGVKEETVEFTDGDFVKVNWKDGNYAICIHKSSDNNELKTYATYFSNNQNLNLGGTARMQKGDNKKFSIPTEEEKQLLLDALHNIRKIWNPETRAIEEDKSPRVGDKCVFWDEEDECVLVSIYVGFRNDEFKHVSKTGAYQYCVRFQDFDFNAWLPEYL